MPKLILKYSTDLQIGIAAVLYFSAAWLGHALAFTGTALAVWPPSGMAFALLILMGRQVWPGIAMGALAANLLAFWNQQGSKSVSANCRFSLYSRWANGRSSYGQVAAYTMD
jgi:integral membrane sensor domain MASE1